MNIVIITSEFGSEAGGLSFACWNFTRILKELGHKLTLASSVEKSDLSKYDKEINIIQSKICIEKGGYRNDLSKHLFFKTNLFYVIEELKTKSIDLIIAFGAGENGFFASELSTRLKTPLILLLRGSEINLSISDMTLRQQNYIALSRSDVVIGLSNELIENSKSIYYSPEIKYEVIPNSIKKPKEINININSDRIILGCGAHHVNEKKGIANLITAFADIKKVINRAIYLEIVGEIDDDLHEKYEKLILDLGLIHQIKLIGGVSRDKFSQRMKSWDFYIQTSFGEGFSNSVAEYLSLGKAFLLSDTGFIAESLRNNFKDIILESHEPKKIATKISQLIQKEDLKSYFEDGYKAIISKTDEAVIYNKWQDTISKIKIREFRPMEQNNILSVIFHDISLDENSNIDVSLRTFESFVDSVSKRGYTLCSSLEYFKSQNKTNLIICTFDDGYENLYKFALPVLKKYNFSATVFVCFDYIGKLNNWNFKDTKQRQHLNTSQLIELQKNGWEIGSHGFSHRSLLRLTDGELYNELIDSKAKLENIFGNIDSYAYPYGDFNDYIKTKVQENYSFAFSLSKGGTLNGFDNHQIRRYFVSDLKSLLEK
jgi:glycosyltransferase involved in cell wall biosynthesis